MSNLTTTYKDLLVSLVSNESEITEQSIDDSAVQLRFMPMFMNLSDTEVEGIKIQLKSELSIKLDMGALIQERNHEKWFLARKSSLSMAYWNRYRRYLINDKKFSPKVVNSMGDILDTLTDLLGDPIRNVAYQRRGLIIGDVQSGKTANYTGLICKAVDSGYKVVVLLTGTIERLRRQTQERIDDGFVGVASDALIKKRDDVFTGVGHYDSSIRPVCLTSTKDDFKVKNATSLGFDLNNINGSVIFVIKKNMGVLKRLNEWFKKFNLHGKAQIDHSLLMIDDEADNASINTNSEEKPTQINYQIRDMLNLFKKASYVGFTATPYANIFIDPDSEHDMLAQDLFPKDYIYSLESPTNYIGARDIFNEDGKANFMLQSINVDVKNEQSIASILPCRHKKDVHVWDIPEDLKAAIDSFVLANTVEDLRGMANTHRSMLVNISRFNNVQTQITDLVNEYLKEIQIACRVFGKTKIEIAEKDERIFHLKQTFLKQYSSTVEFAWEDVFETLYAGCAGIIVQTMNMRSGQNINFDDYKEGLRMIAVGGMSLSRGLTLEGLVVSYFYRNSKMYDTLMQMGRWFGYRKGYADLCRIWMSDESVEWYRQISLATDELRAEVQHYQDSDLTPMDFGLRVRSDLTTLIVTAKNKMKSTENRECVISLSGETIETPELYSDQEKNQINLSAAKKLTLKLLEDGKHPETSYDSKSTKQGFLNVPERYILNFLDEIEVSPKNEHFNVSAIKKFILSYQGDELKKWDIAFASGKSKKVYSITDGLEITEHPIRQYSIENNGKILKMNGSKRRLGTSNDGRFGLDNEKIKEIVKSYTPGKSLPQKEYFKKSVKRNPLLTIYYVECGEFIGQCTDENLAVEEACKGEIYVGFGIGFPTLADQETKYVKYVLNKIAVRNMFDGDDEELDFDDLDEEGQID